MPSTIPYSLVFVGIILAASLAVLGQVGPCELKTTCQECVMQKINVTEGNNGTCVFELTRSGQQCKETFVPSEDIIQAIYQAQGCESLHTSTTAAPPNTTTTPQPPTTTSTTPPSTTTNGTTPTTTTVPSTTTNGTAPTTPPSTTTTGGTSTTTTPAPSNATTVAPPPAPTPRKGGFAWGEFIGGIVFAVAVSSLAYLIWRFYKARLDRNYHTFSNPTF